MRRKPTVLEALAGILAATLLFSFPTRAGADCRVLPGPEGEISTWLVAGAIATPQSHPSRAVLDQLDGRLAQWDLNALVPTAGAPLPHYGSMRWLAAATADARFDFDQALHGRDARFALAGIDVEASAGGTFQLFLGSDDAIAVVLDGRIVFRRGGVRDAVDDDDRVLLTIAPGHHHLVFAVYVNGGAMHVCARVVDAHFQPPTDLQWSLAGVDDVTCDALSTASLHTQISREAVASGTHVTINVTYPGGVAHRAGDTRASLHMTAADSSIFANSPVEFANSASAFATLEATFPLALTRASIDLSVGEPARSIHLRDIDFDIPSIVRETLLRARVRLATLSETNPPPWLPRESFTSIEWVTERLADLVSDHDSDQPHLIAESTTLAALLDALDNSRDPYALRHGPMRRGYRSDIDGTLQGYSIYVPPSYRGDRPFPVVVALHGLSGTAHRMLAVLFGLYDENEPRTHADRYLPQLPDTQAILVAPYGYGDAGYRQLGEVDVLRVLAEVQRAYRVDSDRTYMTGLSMGGIGAASIPFHNPDLFAAIAPLCGYHSYFVRHDTDGVRRPWESFLMEARSNALWAENGLHLPLYVVHGTQDLPVENSRVLVDRYTALHYRVESEWPDLGHNVWSTTYANGRIVPYFLQFRRDPTPRHVHFRTANLRFAHSYWLTIDAIAHPRTWADVDAAIRSDTLSLEVTGASALTVTPPANLLSNNRTGAHVRIGHDSIDFSPGESVSLSLSSDGHWSRASRPTNIPLGPIRDVFDRPIAVVYGTQDPDERSMDLRVARAWARIHAGIRVRIPVITDDAVTDAFAQSHALVLVGTERANSYYHRIAPRLPIRMENGAILAGNHRYTGEQVGATFVVSNPDAPSQSVIVVTGTNALGVWRSRFMPELVPDFAIYDESISLARGRIILGEHASVLAAGFFELDGSVPVNAVDPDRSP